MLPGYHRLEIGDAILKTSADIFRLKDNRLNVEAAIHKRREEQSRSR